MLSIRSGAQPPADGCSGGPLPAPLRRATEVLACPHCRGRLCPDERSLVCELGHRFDVARRGSVRLDVGRGRVRHAGDGRDMIEARRVFFEAGGFRAVTAALATITAEACRSRPSSWLLDVGAGTGHHAEGILDRLGDGHGVAIDVSRHALATAARRHPRLAAIGADVWSGLPVRGHAVDVIVVAFAPRNAAEMHRVLQADGRLLVVTPTAGHLRELPVRACVDIDAQKCERLRRQLGCHFELERSVRISDRVPLDADLAGALYRMGPWARHDVTPQPVEAVSVAVDLSVYRPRSLRKSGRGGRSRRRGIG
jgi:23S rRNA (guanine745-N1)-methyltransferase